MDTTNIETEMNWIMLLAFATFVLVVAFLLWNRASTKEHQRTGGNMAGIGGPNDPMVGSTAGIRPPNEMRASLNAASAGRTAGSPLPKR
jgi:hypothetical protein